MAQTLEQAVSQCSSLAQSRQLTPQEANYCQRVYQVAQCVSQQRQRANNAQQRIYDARIQRAYCNTDACVDAWNIKESEARQDNEDAMRDMNSQRCFR